MTDHSKDDESKKDLTGILELSSLMPAPTQDEEVKESEEPVPVEQIDTFEAINDLGFFDHAQTEPQPAEPIKSEELVEPAIDTPPEARVEFMPAPELEPLDSIKDYSERAQEASVRVYEKVPFHLNMNGDFDPYARDKLLMFIDENPIGLNSSELDRQIAAGRVLFPRISEFAGIKLIQDLRDSGLTFKLSPSPRDDDELLPPPRNLRVEYDARNVKAKIEPLPILSEKDAQLKSWKAFDSISLVQFLRAEIVEVERSSLYQELMDRMLLSLKRKAHVKGAHAIGSLQHELKPLRLPSEYEVSLTATLYKKS